MVNDGFVEQVLLEDLISVTLMAAHTMLSLALLSRSDVDVRNFGSLDRGAVGATKLQHFLFRRRHALPSDRICGESTLVIKALSRDRLGF